MKNKLRSPFFYVGDKYKIMPQIVQFFPHQINRYYEPFLGGGSSVLHVKANEYILNDINEHIIQLHRYISSFIKVPEKLFERLFEIIKTYKLSCSYLGDIVPEVLRKEYVKTYYSKYNKDKYVRLRNDFNASGDISLLYILLIYGFNHMIRFNKEGKFNLPVGNVDFNKNVYNAILDYLLFMDNKKIEFSNLDYIDFDKNLKFEKGDFIYLDPPYLISNSEYTKNWQIEDEEKLYNLIDYLDEIGVHFGLSNMLEHKGNINYILEERMIKYKVYDIQSNYISCFDNTIKTNSKEVYLTNYEQKE